MNRFFCHNTTRLVTATAAVLLCTLPAPARGDQDTDVISVSPGGVVARTAVIAGDTTTAIWNDNDHVVELKIKDGKITVRVDGEEIPHDRIQQAGGQIIILDEDGNEMRSLGLGPGGGDLGLPGVGRGHMTSGPPPKVMIGVHLGEPGEALRTHLRLEPGETTMINGLYEGLPAHNAGLQQHDIIVAVDGRRPAGQQDVMEALSELDAGDEITFTVIHKGRTREYAVTLDEFDRTRMESSRLIGAGAGGAFVFSATDPQIFEVKPGESFDWQKYLIDPDTRDMWRFLGDSGLSRRLQKQLQDRLPEDLDDRLERLNDRIDEVKEMIDMLIEQARDAARETERGN